MIYSAKFNLGHLVWHPAPVSIFLVTSFSSPKKSKLKLYKITSVTFKKKETLASCVPSDHHTVTYRLEDFETSNELTNCVGAPMQANEEDMILANDENLHKLIREYEEVKGTTRDCEKASKFCLERILEFKPPKKRFF